MGPFVLLLKIQDLDNEEMERPTGLEPVSPAWEAGAQPIYQGRYNLADPVRERSRRQLSLPSANGVLQSQWFVGSDKSV
jgi:hypothetical protein